MTPLIIGCQKNNVEMVKLIIKYAHQYNIILKYDKNEIGNNSEIIQLLEEYENGKELKM
eukprot:jgi/Orpsp1_1/1182050/evm.model.c7180000079673.1